MPHYYALCHLLSSIVSGGGVNGSLANGHYGLGDRKSRKEIMEEIIAKSKVITTLFIYLPTTI
jgi:hypothetical protein